MEGAGRDEPVGAKELSHGGSVDPGHRGIDVVKLDGDRISGDRRGGDRQEQVSRIDAGDRSLRGITPRYAVEQRIEAGDPGGDERVAAPCQNDRRLRSDQRVPRQRAVEHDGIQYRIPHLETLLGAEHRTRRTASEVLAAAGNHHQPRRA